MREHSEGIISEAIQTHRALLLVITGDALSWVAGGKPVAGAHEHMRQHSEGIISEAIQTRRGLLLVPTNPPKSFASAFYHALRVFFPGLLCRYCSAQ